MSLDETSHPDRTGTDELVPSRYALRVGEIDVLVISDGVFHLPAASLASDADPADLAASLKDRFQSPDAYTWALNAVVVRSGGRTILIDSGVGSEFPNAPQAGRLATRLDASGIDPASVTDVVITHMHVDHVGGLLADRFFATHLFQFVHKPASYSVIAGSSNRSAPWCRGQRRGG